MMKTHFALSFSLTFLFGLLALLPYSCTSDQLPPPSLDFCDSLNMPPLTYDADIQTLINTYCATPGCHLAGFSDGDFTTYSGMLSRLDNGKTENRTIVLGDMPPAGLPRMTDEELDKFRCWLSNNYPEN